MPLEREPFEGRETRRLLATLYHALIVFTIYMHKIFKKGLLNFHWRILQQDVFSQDLAQFFLKKRSATPNSFIQLII